MHFPTKKMGVNFFHRKKTKPVGGGGDSRGVWQKTRLFPDFYSATFPKFFSVFFFAPFPYDLTAHLIFIDITGDSPISILILCRKALKYVFSFGLLLSV